MLGELAGRDRWLVVFDNAEDPPALRPFLPHGPGQVLITSRTPAWRRIAAPLAVHEFTRAESISLLRTLAPDLSDAQADRLADAVGDLPLVLDQAGSLLADAVLDVDTYLGLLDRRAGELLAQDAGGTYPISVAASWSVAFDRLAVDEPAALDLLTLIAWCGPEPVPLDLVTDHPDRLPDRLAATVADPLALARCTQVLHRRAVGTVAPHSIGVHRIPAALLRSRSRDDEVNSVGWAAVLVRLLRRALPEQVWDNPAVWPRWQELLPHVLAAVDPDRQLDDVRDEVSWLLTKAAGYRLTRGGAAGGAAAVPARAQRPPGAGSATTTPPPSARPTISAALYTPSVSTDGPATSTRTPSPVVAASSATTTLIPSPRLPTSPPTYARSASTSRPATSTRTPSARCRRILGEDDPSTLLTADISAPTSARWANTSGPATLDHDTLARCRRLFGDDHPDTLLMASNLALDLHALGEYQQAHDLDEDTLTRRRRVLGDDHPATLYSATKLAADLEALGDYRQASALYEDTLTRYRRVLGEDHPSTLASANHLAAGLRALGEYQRAHDLDEDTLTRRRRVLGDDHPDTLYSATTSPATCTDWASSSGPAPRRGHPHPPPPSPRRQPSQHSDVGQQPRRRPTRARRLPAGPRPRRGHPHPLPPDPRRRPPRHPLLSQQPRRRPTRARRLPTGTRPQRGHSRPPPPGAGRGPPPHPRVPTAPRRAVTEVGRKRTVGH